MTSLWLVGAVSSIKNGDTLQYKTPICRVNGSLSAKLKKDTLVENEKQKLESPGVGRG